MKLNEIREKNYEELLQESKELKTELYRLRFQHATSNLDNPLQLKEVRRNIARVKTVMRELELEKAQ